MSEQRLFEGIGVSPINIDETSGRLSEHERLTLGRDISLSVAERQMLANQFMIMSGLAAVLIDKGLPSFDIEGGMKLTSELITKSDRAQGIKS